MTEFEPFPKIPRLSRECVVTEKLDGTNASVWILDVDGAVAAPPEAKIVEVNGHDIAVVAGSRNRFITPEKDNAGFGRWVHENAEGLAIELGYGTHFGEWWGSGIQRGYGLSGGEKRFSLFNTSMWGGAELALCRVVPVLYEGIFDTEMVWEVMN